MRGAPVDGEEMDPRWQPFIAWHEYLATTFPLVHSKMKLEKPNRFNLVFTLEGDHKHLKPLVLSQCRRTCRPTIPGRNVTTLKR